jgi:hypothetical protein
MGHNAPPRGCAITLMNINEIDRVLAAEPRNVRALILKADHLANAGDARSASSFYLAALRAAGPAQQVPRELVPDLQRARAMYERYASHYQDYIVNQLAARGFDRATSSERFAQSLDIVLGKKRIYVQEPRYYYFPGLPQIQFYGREPFPWLAAIERETDAIAAELQAVMQQPTSFAPYVQPKANRPPNEQAGMVNNPAWSAFYLWKNGEVVAENAARCPRTMQALQDVPLARVPNRSPSILFSLLRPGAPHSAAQWPGQHAVDLSPAAHRAGAMHVPGRQRPARLAQGPGLAVRRHDRARSVESQRRDARDPAVRRVAARAFAGRACAGRLAVRSDRRLRRRQEARVGDLAHAFDFQDAAARRRQAK